MLVHNNTNKNNKKLSGNKLDQLGRSLGFVESNIELLIGLTFLNEQTHFWLLQYYKKTNALNIASLASTNRWMNKPMNEWMSTVPRWKEEDIGGFCFRGWALYLKRILINEWVNERMNEWLLYHVEKKRTLVGSVFEAEPEAAAEDWDRIAFSIVSSLSAWK